MRRILILLLISAVSCGQWRVSSLNSKEYAFIKNGNLAGNVRIVFDDYALNNLSFDVKVVEKRICVADNSLKRIQVLDSDAKPELVIGSTDNVPKDKVKAVDFKFSIIGQFTMDGDRNLYVQNRLTPSDKRSLSSAQDDDFFSPSYILMFDKKGKLQYTLGQGGKPDVPFYYIESLDIDDKGRLVVVSRSFETWKVYRFKGKNRDFYIDLGKLEFKEQDDKNVLAGKIENIQVFQSGENILISVAFYHDLRLKFRKVYDFSIKENKLNRAIINLPDPKNELFNIVDDKFVYFWNNENKEIKFMICNMEGNIITNKLLNIKGPKEYFSRIFGDKAGKLYSYHVTRDGIKILNWE